MNRISLTLAALLCAALALTACKGGAKDGQTVEEEQAAAAPAGLTEQDFATLQSLYENAEEDHGDEALAKWAFVDVDGDGIDEIWMRDDFDEAGALFTHRDGEFRLIGCETFRMKAYMRERQDGKGYVCIAGPAGGPSYFTQVYTLQDSRVVERFSQLQVYDDIDEAWIDDQTISGADARAYMEALPASKAIVIDGWRWVDPSVPAADLERVPVHENSAGDDSLIKDFVTEMFTEGLYVEESFLEEHCTANLLRQLKDDYEYEGEGYANWDFRSDANDGSGESAILKFEKKDGRYYYEGNDGGTLFRNILSAFVRDGKVMMDGIVRDRTYYSVPE